MNRLKAIFARLLFPPGWAVTLVSLAGYGGLAWAFGMGQAGPLAYLAYLLSAYALAVNIAALPRIQAALRKRARYFKEHSRLFEVLHKTTFGAKYLDDRAFRARISLYQSMAVNFLYTVFRAVLGVRYASTWFISLAVYYLMLGALRAYLAIRYRKRPGGADTPAYEWRCYQTTGCLLLLLNIPMSGMVVLMVRTNSGFAYPGLVIYLSAMYTFYMTAHSVVNLHRFRKMDSPILLAGKAVSFISAAMSLLGLQTAMISQFGENDSAFRRQMNATTGAGVCILVIAAVYMIVHSRRMTRKESGQ